MRCFIALLPTKEESVSLAQAARRISQSFQSGRPCAAPNVHLTLAFLGEIHADVVLATKNALAPYRLSPAVAWSLSRWGIFGQALWVAGKACADIQTRATLVRSALDMCGIPFDKKAFRAHITLARSWSLPCPIWTGPALTIHLSAPVLMQSVRDAQGRLIYHRVE